MKTEKNYTIVKVLNNSSVIVKDLFFEVIFMGRGIGFGHKPGELLAKGSEYDKSYKLTIHKNEFHRIISGYSDDIVVMVMETIRQITKHDFGSFGTEELITLADHLAAMFQRIESGVAVTTYFSHETKALYPQSFAHAQQLCEVILNNYRVEIPDAEIAYIALYIQNLRNAGAKRQLEQLHVVVIELEQYLIEHGHELNKDSIHYARLLTHIRFIVESTLSNKKALNQVVSTTIVETYPVYADYARDIIAIIEKEIGVGLAEDELAYLVIHLVNVLEN
ncbi:PRD domain-containing protein [Erysipelothrix anatis]|uniref:PRD domain-containing protein n=1 Tax=Erysipelothrix anatis TaxID=2683713 RepID=UPI00135C6788|nr:PRD domain-containing protein [Erysipelothrix anatis]